jgi:vitamin B12 transporter
VQAERQGLDDFAVFDSKIAYGLTEDVDLYLRIENLFDTEYQTLPGYGTADRTFHLGLRAAF